MRRPWRCRACHAVVERSVILYRSADRPLRFVEGLPTGWEPLHVYALADIEDDGTHTSAGPYGWEEQEPS